MTRLRRYHAAVWDEPLVLELSRDRAEIGFVEYLKAGVPVTLATTAAGFLMLYLFHAATWV